VQLLVLGGTEFLGRALVEAALERGDAVTTFTRGKTNPDLFPEAERLRGERDADLRALEGRTWDAVVDLSGYVPRVVRASAELLEPSVGRYVFVSSISVYADLSGPVSEDSATATLDDPSSEDVTSHYGPLKAACEVEVERVYSDRSLIVRPGLIAGPHDLGSWILRADGFLLEQGVGEWMELPLWIGSPPYGGMMRADVSRAVSAGLTFRPLVDTARAALNQAERVEGVGLTPEREAQLLAAWSARA
jgi:nucleoside-diphosphate-sugar epimerase